MKQVKSLAILSNKAHSITDYPSINIPDKFVEVTAILPEYQAFIVKQWEKEAQRSNK